MEFFDFASVVEDRKDRFERLSVVVTPRFPFSGGFKTITIDAQYRFRPDKLADEEYGDEKLSWVIDLFNNFEHGFKEYEVGASIKIPTIATLREMGIL